MKNGSIYNLLPTIADIMGIKGIERKFSTLKEEKMENEVNSVVNQIQRLIYYMVPEKFKVIKLYASMPDRIYRNSR